MYLKTKIKVFISITILLILNSCNNSIKIDEIDWNKLPEVTELTDLKETDFAITLENQISTNKNTIYAPTFLYVWDKIVEKLNNPILQNESNSNEFKLLINSKSHKNSLNENEYLSEVNIENGAIYARAFFNKTLTFKTKLQLLDNSIKFSDNKSVEAFGMNYFDEDLVKFSRILYYFNDDNFILQLTPKDTFQEIILVKGLHNYKTLSEALIQTNTLILKGNKMRNNLNQSWKYSIIKDDIFSIPKLKFNISTNFLKIEGQHFSTKDKNKHSIEEAYQRTAFIFNENGAIVESEAFALVDSIGEEPNIKRSKKLIFDKHFLIIIKRKEQKNPYFVMNVNNSELMIKK